MKNRFPFLWLLGCLAFVPALSAPTLIDMSLVNNPVSSNKLEVRLRPTLTVASGAYSAGVFTVRAPVALGGTLNVFSSAYNYAFAGPAGTDGTYNYYRFQFVQNFVVNWNAGQEYVAAILEYSAGPATGAFELVTGTAWTNSNNGNFYQELNGLEAEGIFYQQPWEISGNVEWYNAAPTGSGIKDATVSLSGAAAGSDDTDVNGDFAIPYSTGGNITVKPVKNTNKLNGITTADAAAIQQYVTNLTPITDPYRLIAADVNKSNTVTTLDATILNQALLGSPSAMSQFKTSWRFVPQAYALSLPPWGFPEQINLTGISGNQTGQDFYGVKTGDIVSTYATPAKPGTGQPLNFQVQDCWLEADKEIAVEFKADQVKDLSAFQFALRFDPAALTLLAIEPLSGAPLSMGNFGTFNLEAGEIRVVWSAAAAIQLKDAAPVFRLRFKALSGSVPLSELLRLDETVLPAHAYNAALANFGVTLQFVKTVGN